MKDLDALLNAARDAQPEPLDDAATDALVRAARQRAASDPSEVVERLVNVARDAEPQPLTDPEIRTMARRAAMAGRARHGHWTRRRVMATAGVGAACAAAAVCWLMLRPGLPDRAGPIAEGDTDRARHHHVETSPPAEPTDVMLSTGDRLVASPGARFHVELETIRERRVRLGSGSMLFDVRRVEGGRFSVATGNAEVIVLGTVFSVRTNEHATTVRVYEGAVEVRGADGVRVVRAGGLLHLGSGTASVDPLSSAGLAAAAARGSHALAAREHATPELDQEIARQVAPVVPADTGTEIVGDPTITDPEASSAEATRANGRPDPRAARTALARGDAAAALALADRAIALGEHDPWRMLRADALRALGQRNEAADAYADAARELSAPQRQQAGFLEARIRANDLADPDGALAALRNAEVTGPHSVLRERGMALEARLLVQRGREAEGRAVAERYVAAFPNGPEIEIMRRLVAHESE